MKRQSMPDILLPFNNGVLPTYVADPLKRTPYPGIVVIHDALGMSTDIHRQCDWLAQAGYRAAAPDLFSGKTVFSCIFTAIKQFRKRKGLLFDKIETVRRYLLYDPNSNGKIGVIGFCFGGGFAVLLSVGYGFESASINYGPLPKDAEEFLKNACPIVASYGALDRNLRGEAKKLKTILDRHKIEHDIKEYEMTDHAFMNDHKPEEIPFIIKVISLVFGGGSYNAESADDARKRIISFFDKHLK